MPVLPDAERQKVWAEWMRENRTPVQAGKGALRDTVNAIDQWLEDHKASLDAAIPLPARSQLTEKQKAWLLFHVARRRFEVS